MVNMAFTQMHCKLSKSTIGGRFAGRNDMVSWLVTRRIALLIARFDNLGKGFQGQL